MLAADEETAARPTPRARASRTGRRADGRGRRGVLELDPAAIRLPAPQRPRARIPTTSTSPPPRSAAASCAPGTRSPGPAREPRARRAPPRAGPRRAGQRRRAAGRGRPEFDELTPVPPSAGCRSTATRDDVLCPGRRPARAARARPAGAGPRREPLGPHHAAARDRPRRPPAPRRTCVIVLLVDERPEEATAWREAMPDAEFAIATAEMAPRDQVRVAELALAARPPPRRDRRGRRPDRRLAHPPRASPPATPTRSSGSSAPAATSTGGGSLTVVATVLADGAGRGRGRASGGHHRELAGHPRPRARRRRRPSRRSTPRECRISNEEELREPDELEAVRRLRASSPSSTPPEAAALLRERIEELGLERRAARRALGRL